MRERRGGFGRTWSQNEKGIAENLAVDFPGSACGFGALEAFDLIGNGRGTHRASRCEQAIDRFFGLQENEKIRFHQKLGDDFEEIGIRGQAWRWGVAGCPVDRLFNQARVVGKKTPATSGSGVQKEVPVLGGDDFNAAMFLAAWLTGGGGERGSELGDRVVEVRPLAPELNAENATKILLGLAGGGEVDVPRFQLRKDFPAFHAGRGFLELRERFFHERPHFWLGGDPGESGARPAESRERDIWHIGKNHGVCRSQRGGLRGPSGSLEKHHASENQNADDHQPDYDFFHGADS